LIERAHPEKAGSTYTEEDIVHYVLTTMSSTRVKHSICILMGQILRIDQYRGLTLTYEQIAQRMLKLDDYETRQKPQGRTTIGHSAVVNAARTQQRPPPKHWKGRTAKANAA
jgi:hypothetical protein